MYRSCSCFYLNKSPTPIDLGWDFFFSFKEKNSRAMMGCWVSRRRGRSPAKGIETRRAETQARSRSDESPVARSDIRPAILNPQMWYVIQTLMRECPARMHPQSTQVACDFFFSVAVEKNDFRSANC